MEVMSTYPFQKTDMSKLKATDFNQLEFGKYTADHMLISDYKNGQWQNPAIVPFANLSLSPATVGLHYGQTIFEGMKAMRMTDGGINIFRLEKHYDRFVKSAERMCIPPVPRDIFIAGLKQLVHIDKEWVPKKTGDALYIRPLIFACEATFGVSIPTEYKFIIFTGPVPALYAAPVKVKVETDYIRAAKGGTGFAKCGGNYGGAYYPSLLAKQQGYDQILWTDSKDHYFIEESGSMNVFFVINNILVTPPLSDSILNGITRDCLLTLAASIGIPIEERQISVTELKKSFEENILREAFGAGTAAVVAPIKTIGINEKDYHLPEYDSKSICIQLREKLASIRLGNEADLHNWNTIL